LGGPVGAVSTGIGLLGAAGSLFGGNGNNAAALRAQANANGEADTLGGIQHWYGDQAGQQLDYFNEDNAGARTAAGNLLRYYQTDPYTDGRMAHDLNVAKGGLDANIARARFANIARSTRSGNVTGAGGPSSTSAGVDAYLAAQDALGTMQAQGRVAQAAYDNTGQRLTAANALEQGLAGQDYSRTQLNEGRYADTTNQELSYWSNQAAQDRALAAQQAGGAMAGLQGLGQGLTYMPSYNQGYSNIMKSLSVPALPGDLKN